jgi:hypothetical protein
MGHHSSVRSRLQQVCGTFSRSREKFDELHIRGAVNLSFPDFHAASLAKIIPSARAPSSTEIGTSQKQEPSSRSRVRRA